jgi:hypothetical protein
VFQKARKAEIFFEKVLIPKIGVGSPRGTKMVSRDSNAPGRPLVRLKRRKDPELP